MQDVKVSSGSQFYSFIQLTERMICLRLHYFFHLPNKHNNVQQKKANVYYNIPLTPWALRHSIFCLVHLNKVVLITAELSVSNIYLTEKSVCDSFYETHGIYKEEHHPSKTGKFPGCQGNSFFSLCYFLLNGEQKADWFPHWTNGRPPPRDPQSWGEGDYQ